MVYKLSVMLQVLQMKSYPFKILNMKKIKSDEEFIHIFTKLFNIMFVNERKERGVIFWNYNINCYKHLNGCPN